MLHFLTALPVEATDERYAAKAPPSQQHEEAAETRGRVHCALACMRLACCRDNEEASCCTVVNIKEKKRL